MVYGSILRQPGWKANDFLFYCCPDCDERTKEKKDFLEHAFTHIHINDSKDILFEPVIKLEESNTELIVAESVVSEPIASQLIVLEPRSGSSEENELVDYETITPDDYHASEEQNLSEETEIKIPANKKRARKAPLKKTEKKPKVKNEKAPSKRAEEFKITCWDCGEDFYPKSKMILHMQTVHGHDNIYKCNHCDTLFKNKMKFDVHKFTEHGEGHVQTFMCTECPYTTFSAANLWHHVDRKHKDGMKKTKLCPHCPKMFRDGHLNDHIRQVHTIARHKCNECDEMFTSVKELRDHSIDVHKRTSFDCDRCDARFTTKSGLEGHVLNIHEKNYPFKCTMCDNAYANKKNLNRHMSRSHTEVKPYACELCDLRFVFPSDLSGHVKAKHEGARRINQNKDPYPHFLSNV